MKIFKNIREFFWPLLLDKSAIHKPESLTEIEIKDIARLKEVFNHAFTCYNEEEERRKTIENKSSLLIGTISVITSVILGITTIFFKENNISEVSMVLVFFLFLLTVYMARTIWFSIKVLERKAYHSLSLSDFLLDDSNENYYKTIIAKLSEIIKNNQYITNGKVDNMTMAQEYFKRAIVVVAIYSFILFLFLTSKVNFCSFLRLINTIQVNDWNMIILYVLSISSLIISIIAIKKKK